MNEVETKLDKKYKPKGIFDTNLLSRKDVLHHTIFRTLISFADDVKDTRIDNESRPSK